MGHMHHMKQRKNSNGSYKGGIPSIENARRAFMTVDSRDNPSPLRLPKLKYGNRKPSLQLQTINEPKGRIFAG
jgi:hypothetical protein